MQDFSHTEKKSKEINIKDPRFLIHASKCMLDSQPYQTMDSRQNKSQLFNAD